MRTVLNITKALADENRLRVLVALQPGELCVCQITEFLGLAMSTVSKHLSILSQAGLVEGRKQGRWMYYRLPEPGGGTEASEAITWVARSLRGNRQILEDGARLKALRRVTPNDLCRKRKTC